MERSENREGHVMTVQNNMLQKELKLFKQLLHSISSALNLNQLFNLIIDSLLNYIDAEVGIFLLKEGNNFIPSATIGLSMEILQNIFVDKEPLFEHIKNLKTPLRINVLNKNVKIDVAVDVNLNSLLILPLISHNSLIGFIIIGNKTNEKEFSEKDIENITNILSQIIVIVEYSILYEEILNLKNYNDSIINSITSGVITTNLHGEIITINKSAEFVLGIKAEDVIHKPIQNIFQNVLNKDFNIENAIKHGENILNREITLEKEDKTFVVLGLSLAVLKDRKNHIIGSVVSMEDLTEKIALENQIRRAEQLSALGEMSAGIAHEIKNPLTSIYGFTSLLPKKLDDKKFLDKYITTVTREVNRLNKIVERFLSFAKPRMSGTQSCNLNDVIENSLSLLHFQIKKSEIILKKNLLPLPPLMGDPQQLEQVCINLIMNAIQIMDKKKKVLKISTGVVLKRMLDNQFQEFIVLKVNDNGPGIPEDKIDKIFNPFYTTKVQGTGLGLSISSQIIEEHNGTIEVSSSQDEGTTFYIYLPAKKEEDNS